MGLGIPRFRAMLCVWHKTKVKNILTGWRNEQFCSINEMVFFFFLFYHAMQHLSSPTRDLTHTPCFESVESWLRLSRICLQCRRPSFNPWVGKMPWRRKWLLTPEFLPEEWHGHRSQAGCSPWGSQEQDRTERLTRPFHILCPDTGP